MYIPTSTFYDTELLHYYTSPLRAALVMSHQSASISNAGTLLYGVQSSQGENSARGSPLYEISASASSSSTSLSTSQNTNDRMTGCFSGFPCIRGFSDIGSEVREKALMLDTGYWYPVSGIDYPFHEMKIRTRMNKIAERVNLQ